MATNVIKTPAKVLEIRAKIGSAAASNNRVAVLFGLHM